MFASVFAGAFALLLVYIAVLVHGIYRKRGVLSPVPGLKETFVLGHALHFLNKPPTQILETLMRGFKECGNVFKVFLLHDNLVFVSDPKICEAVLSSQKLITKSSEYKLLANWMGTGLLSSSGIKWRNHRKIITPAFHFKILEDFVNVFDKNAAILVERMEKETSPSKPVNIYPYVTLAALDVICETSMGYPINAQRNSGSEYVGAVKEMSNVLHIRMFDAFLRIPFFFQFSELGRRETKALKTIHRITESVIVNRRKELLREKESGVEATEVDNGLGMKKKQALLDILLQSTINGIPLTNNDIREEVDTFVFEGHDTVSSGISFALYCLAKNPEVQKKAFAEISEVIGNDKNRPITLQTLNDLHYLELVVKESLRIFPSVPLIGRLIEEDIVLNNVKFPSGTTLIPVAYAMHRNPEIFPEPEKFIPERFLNNETLNSNPYAYIPFSAGPRNCVGQKFAMLQLKSMVSKVLRHFELSEDPSYEGPKLMAEVVLKAENGVNVILTPRQ